MTTGRSFTAPGQEGVLRFTDAESVLSAVQEVLVGWRLEESPAIVATDQVVLSVVGIGARWRVSGVTVEADIWFDDPVSAACSVVANLLQVRMLAEQHFLCLHTAAVEVDGGLVLMPCRYRAGKSLLTATLAAAGQRIFNDDVVLLDPGSGEAVAPGIAARLRLPLPDRLDSATRAFLDSCPGPQGRHYRYLSLPEAIMARQGERAPIRGFVLLDRRDDGPAKLTRVAPGALLRQLIWQNFARAGAPERILETLAAQVGRADCLQLTYSDLAEARELLLNHFANGASDLHRTAPIPVCPDRAAGTAPMGSLDLPAGARLVRAERAHRIERAGEAFLTTAEVGSILHLNALASCLWTLLEEPLSYGDVLATFDAAFPATGIEVLDRDLKRAIADFKVHRLVEVQCPPTQAPRRRSAMAAAIALVAAVTFADTAAASTIEGCEARDIGALLAPGAKAAWSSKGKALGSLRFSHQVALACAGEHCQVDGGLRQEELVGGLWTGIPDKEAYAATDRSMTRIASLPFGSAMPIQSQRFDGTHAASLEQTIDERGYRDAAGDLRYVWVDYGRIAGEVNLRARSEIVCQPGKDSCLVSTAILAYVVYSERRPCPQFSAD